MAGPFTPLVHDIMMKQTGNLQFNRLNANSSVMAVVPVERKAMNCPIFLTKQSSMLPSWSLYMLPSWPSWSLYNTLYMATVLDLVYTSQNNEDFPKQLGIYFP